MCKLVIVNACMITDRRVRYRCSQHTTFNCVCLKSFPSTRVRVYSTTNTISFVWLGQKQLYSFHLYGRFRVTYQITTRIVAFDWLLYLRAQSQGYHTKITWEDRGRCTYRKRERPSTVLKKERERRKEKKKEKKEKKGQERRIVVQSDQR